MIRSDKRYMGKPCRHGHDGERYVRDDTCVHCRYIHVCRQKGRQPTPGVVKFAEVRRVPRYE